MPIFSFSSEIEQFIQFSNMLSIFVSLFIKFFINFVSGKKNLTTKNLLILTNLLKICFYCLFVVADSNLHSGTNGTASVQILSTPKETPTSKVMMSENGFGSKSESYSSLFGTREKGSTSNSEVNIKELDLEKVLEEQETHDLYCPNCNSCITRRVILKKRKRIAKDVKSDFRPEKLPNLGQIETANENLDEREETNILFKCLSCFSFFIPTGMYNITIVYVYIIVLENDYFCDIKCYVYIAGCCFHDINPTIIVLFLEYFFWLT